MKTTSPKDDRIVYLMVGIKRIEKLITMSRKRKAFTFRTLLIGAITLLIVPFGFTLENPRREIGAFLGK